MGEGITVATVVVVVVTLTTNTDFKASSKLCYQGRKFIFILGQAFPLSSHDFTIHHMNLKERRQLIADFRQNRKNLL
jgi:hypothetical protein